MGKTGSSFGCEVETERGRTLRKSVSVGDEYHRPSKMIDQQSIPLDYSGLSGVAAKVCCCAVVAKRNSGQREGEHRYGREWSSR